ncbi:hypothetical protein WJR50_15210 [Catalinimonas sp. 4WD22]|uniref:hypothetical protein n=1 Tax=Catalinimonas locisalis TaxID=3133978 RepID=UPI003100C04F
MTNKEEIVKAASDRLENYFDLKIRENGADILLEKVRQKLTLTIEHYLAHDIETLLNLLYRIDVTEKDVKQAMLEENPAEKLTDLIITRELQKAETRIQYRYK